MTLSIPCFHGIFQPYLRKSKLNHTFKLYYELVQDHRIRQIYV